MKLLIPATLLLCVIGATAADAHEVWIERDGRGPARIYLGEPADALPPGGDPEFARLQAPKLVGAPAAAMVRRAGWLEVDVPAGDVRAWDDSVFQPWGEAGARESVVYYARAGRAEPRATMPFEIAPTTANGNRFVLVRNGQPVPATAVTVISPDKWTRQVTTAADGTITLPTRGKGRYLMTATIVDEGAHQTPAGPVAKLHRIATTSVVVS